MARSDIDRVAAELYALPPEEFTPARDQRAAQARASGQAALASEIRALRKPTQGAWVVNLLARESPDALSGLLDLGASLREAQAKLQGDELRRLSVQRGQVVGALARDAADLARAAGRAPTPAVLREVEQTLEAALADPQAAEAVREGRLSSALSYAGFGTPAEAGAVPKRATSKSAPPKAKRSPDDLSRLQEAAAKAANDVEDSQTAVRTAEEAHREWQQRVQEQQEALEHARREEASAALEVRETLRRQKAAVKAAQSAERRLAQARDTSNSS
jgi:hypothetical protein